MKGILKYAALLTMICYLWGFALPTPVYADPGAGRSTLKGSQDIQSDAVRTAAKESGVKVQTGEKKARKKFPWLLVGIGAVVVTVAVLLLTRKDDALPASQSSLDITSSPSGAHIFLDGKDTGRTSPTSLTEVLVGGAHVVKLVRDGYLDYYTTVYVKTPQSMQLVHANLVSSSAAPPRVEMVQIGGGAFTMGDPVTGVDSSYRRVTLSSFFIGATEVTQGQWKAVMGGNPSRSSRGDSYPVDSVNWDEVQVFIAQLNRMSGKRYRLPTDAEWEYAARGQSAEEQYGDINEIAWYDANASGATHPVGQLRPNRYGLYDILGNVYEWCQDWYGPLPSEPQTNPTGPSTGDRKVQRSGSWRARSDQCSIYTRYDNQPDIRFDDLGLRLVCDSL